MFTCQNCGIEAPTRHVIFYQNIGAFFRRYYKKIEGDLCKRCVNKYFLSFTGTTLVLGWWGTISFFASIIYLGNNIVRYIGTLSLPKPAADACAPVLTDSATAKIGPLVNELVRRINNAEPLERTARDIASRAGVTPGQVVLFLSALIKAQGRKSNAA
jgi:hypothetical protein